MIVLVVLAHPDPRSFNHAIASAVVETLSADGHDVRFHDLYAEGFDPLLPSDEIRRDARCAAEVDRHCAELAEAEGIVVVHPNWWGMPPAVLAGWVDRVVRPGVAYEFVEGDAGDGAPVGLLAAGCALVLNTSDTYPSREHEVFGDPLDRIWRDCVFGLCGVPEVERRTFAAVVTSTPEQRADWLDEARVLARECFPGDA